MDAVDDCLQSISHSELRSLSQQTFLLAAYVSNPRALVPY